MQHSTQLGICALVLATALSACDAVQGIMEGCANQLSRRTTPCGTFSYHNIYDRSLIRKPYPGPRANLSFTFTPGACGLDCRCGKVAFIQLLRFRRPDGSDVPVPSLPPERRTSGGWTLDRDEQLEWGYYGMFNGPQQDFDLDPLSTTAIPGRNGLPAELFDAPGVRDERDYDIDTLDAAVCVSGDAACQDGVLGFYRWGWKVRENDHDRTGDLDKRTGVSDEYDEVALEWHTRVFERAVTAWNDNTAGSVRRPFPAMRRLP